MSHPEPEAPHFGHRESKSTTNVLTTTTANYTQRAGITAAAGTRLAPISTPIRFGERLGVTKTHAPSLSLSLEKNWKSYAPAAVRGYKGCVADPFFSIRS